MLKKPQENACNANFNLRYTQSHGNEYSPPSVNKPLVESVQGQASFDRMSWQKLRWRHSLCQLWLWHQWTCHNYTVVRHADFTASSITSSASGYPLVKAWGQLNTDCEHKSESSISFFAITTVCSVIVIDSDVWFLLQCLCSRAILILMKYFSASKRGWLCRMVSLSTSLYRSEVRSTR